MGKLFVLVGLNLKAMLLTFRVGGGKKRTFSGVGTLVLMAGLCLYISGTYSILFALQLKQVGMLSLLLLMMPVMALMAGFIFTVFAAQGVIFGGKDNDLMFSLPISAFTLLLSRLTALYLENLVFSLFVLVPAGVVYLVNGGGAGPLFFPALLLGTAALALLPTLLALVGGFVLSWVASRFAKRSLVTLLLYGVLLAGAIALSFQASFLINDLAASAAGLQTAFHSWGVPFVLFQEAVCGGNLVSLLVLIALCVGPLLLVVWLLAGRYKAVVTRLQSHAAGRAYRPGRTRALGTGRALFQKEAARFFDSAIYFFNAGLGLLFLLLGGVVALVKRETLVDFLSQLDGMGGLPVLPLLAAGVCFCLSTVTVTASSISLEGKQLWILKTAPIPVRTLLLTKVGFQLALALPCTALSVLLLAMGFGLTPGEGVLLLALGVALALFSAPFGLLINLVYPKLDASNDIAVVKQSAAAMIALFVPMALTGLGGVAYMFLSGALGGVSVLLLCLAALLVCVAAVWHTLLRRGPELFAAL